MNDEVASRVRLAHDLIAGELGAVIVDLIPSYASLLMIFDPFLIDHYELRHKLRSLLTTPASDSEQPAAIVELPVYYALETGPDLQRIATHAKCDVEHIIQRHQAIEYRVYAIGFAPGFGYLGRVDESIAMPRLATPRAFVPKGSVAIADRQTAIYPADSPGGWNLIGRCPVELFAADKTPPMPMKVGDRVRFKSVDRDEYLQLGGRL